MCQLGSWLWESGASRGALVGEISLEVWAIRIELNPWDLIRSTRERVGAGKVNRLMTKPSRKTHKMEERKSIDRERKNLNSISPP